MESGYTHPLGCMMRADNPSTRVGISAQPPGVSFFSEIREYALFEKVL